MQYETIAFNPIIKTVGQLTSRTTKEIRDEPMIWTGDYNFARKNGGSITQEFLDKIEATDLWKDNVGQENLYFVLDSRVTHTMPGNYPSMGGWHCDDFNRGEKYGQPKLADRDKRVCHFMALVSEGEVTCTEFITDSVTLQVNPEAVWNSVDNELGEAANLVKRKIKPHEIIFFSQDALHRASECTNAGWRLFIRGSFTYRKPENEIRKQIQVYIHKRGW